EADRVLGRGAGDRGGLDRLCFTARGPETAKAKERRVRHNQNATKPSFERAHADVLVRVVLSATSVFSVSSPVIPRTPKSRRSHPARELLERWPLAARQ